MWWFWWGVNKSKENIWGNEGWKNGTCEVRLCGNVQCE